MKQLKRFLILSICGTVLISAMSCGCIFKKKDSNDIVQIKSLDKFPMYLDHSPPVPVYRISSNSTIHRFFDTSPISPSGRYVALFKMPYENKSPQPGDMGDVMLVDLKEGTEKSIAKTCGWEVQMGANVQWGANDSVVFYNNVDTTSWKPYCAKLNPFTGEIKKLDGTIFMASNDGKMLVSHDLIKSKLAQTGYGVILPDSLVKRNIGAPADDGVYVTDTDTGEEKLLVSIADIYEHSIPSIKIPNMIDYEYYCFQAKWNPQGTKLLTTIQWSPIGGGPRRRVVVTMNADGGNLRTAITADQWAKGGHHINWHPDGKHVTMNLNVRGKEGLEIIKVRDDGTDMQVIYPKGSGHPSFHKNGRYIVTDAYPNEDISFGDGSVPIRLIDTKLQTETCIARIYVSDIGGGEFRTDPHPAWDDSGKYITFNGYVGNTRQVYVADVSKLIEK